MGKREPAKPERSPRIAVYSFSVALLCVAAMLGSVGEGMFLVFFTGALTLTVISLIESSVWVKSLDRSSWSSERIAGTAIFVLSGTLLFSAGLALLYILTFEPS